MATVFQLSDFKSRNKTRVTFEKQELRTLLNVYSRRVATGDWRDYAIDYIGGAAVFSIFRHSFDAPLFAVAKKAGTGGRFDYVVYSGPKRLCQGKTMDEALRVFDRKLRLVAKRG